jgi:hypothetical protein
LGRKVKYAANNVDDGAKISESISSGIPHSQPSLTGSPLAHKIADKQQAKGGDALAQQF